MRTLVHLSDLHFGAVRADIVASLVQEVNRRAPDLVVVSGDLTQRARPSQFTEARRFLSALRFPQLVVPGNHDVPLYNLYARFRHQLARYRRYIAADTEPFFFDPEIAVLGINTARSLTFKNGRVNERQVALALARLASLSGVVKIIVSHHPFDLPQAYPDRELVGRARMAMGELARCGVDLFLAGHYHVGIAEPGTLRFQVGGRAALLIQAGTATSTRSRGEANSFNVICIVAATIAVQRITWDEIHARFIPQTVEYFAHGDDGWSRASQGLALTCPNTAP